MPSCRRRVFGKNASALTLSGTTPSCIPVTIKTGASSSDSSNQPSTRSRAHRSAPEPTCPTSMRSNQSISSPTVIFGSSSGGMSRQANDQCTDLLSWPHKSVDPQLVEVAALAIVGRLEHMQQRLDPSRQRLRRAPSLLSHLFAIDVTKRVNVCTFGSCHESNHRRPRQDLLTIAIELASQFADNPRLAVARNKFAKAG